MNTKPLSDAQIKQFDEDGYIICKGYYDAEEMNLLLKTARADHNMLDHNIPIKDAQGRQSKLSLWNHPGDDIYGMISRGHRMVDASEYKRRQAAPGVKITPRAFGRDWRYPITNGYRR